MPGRWPRLTTRAGEQRLRVGNSLPVVKNAGLDYGVGDDQPEQPEASVLIQASKSFGSERKLMFLPSWGRSRRFHTTINQPLINH